MDTTVTLLWVDSIEHRPYIIRLPVGRCQGDRWSHQREKMVPSAGWWLTAMQGNLSKVSILTDVPVSGQSFEAHVVRPREKLLGPGPQPLSLSFPPDHGLCLEGVSDAHDGREDCSPAGGAVFRRVQVVEAGGTERFMWEKLRGAHHWIRLADYLWKHFCYVTTTKNTPKQNLYVKIVGLYLPEGEHKQKEAAVRAV